jgi:sec-independent protein translocase protein TatA
MPTSLGPAEILVILVVALVVLGPKRLPEAGRQIGKFVREVRHWSESIQTEIRDVIDADGESAPPPPAPVSPAQPAPVPTPPDLGPPPIPPASPAPQPAAPRPSAAAEWGLATPAPAPTSPPAAPASDGIPAEWATPPSSNGDHA